MNRRRFNQGAAATFISLLPAFARAQETEEGPDFDVAGSHQMDPPGHKIAWGDLWTEVPLEDVTSSPVAGQQGFLVLDSEEMPHLHFTTKQRLVFETNAVTSPIDPEELMNSFEDLHPATHMGHAPGTVIESRHVTDQGCWFSFGPGPDGGGIEGVIGISLYYTPIDSNTPLLNVRFNLGTGPIRTEAFLEEMDSTVSINGNWLLGMDDLGNFWEAIETSYGWYE